MIHGKKFMKTIAVLVIITFIWQGDLFLYSTSEDGLDELFYKARNEYNNMQYVTSKKRLEVIVGEIKEKVLDREDILGKCYLLLGAIYEKEEKTNLARENYRKAIGDYKVQAIDGVNLAGLVILEKVIKEPRTPIAGEPGVIDRQFNIARDEYVDGKYLNATERLERIIGIIHEKGLARDDIMGKCYLLLGAVYEKENKELLAEENYQKAKEEYDTSSIDSVDDLDKLTIYRRVVKGEKVLSLKGQIEKEGKKTKKKFPWLLVAGGVVVIVIAAILLLKKKYTLTVKKNEGVDGYPASGNHKYKKGETVRYNYSLRDGYSNLIVRLDNTALTSSSGTIDMNTNHTLIAEATVNEVEFVTDKDMVNIDEGGTGTFDVKLSAQPTGNVNVTVSRYDGDEDIRVVSGGNLTFTPSNWNTYQTVTLEAAEDDDAENDEATIRISASGMDPRNITAVGVDNDIIDFITNTGEVSIHEGGTEAFQVRLSRQPPSDVEVNISRVGGDNDISVSAGANLTFTPSNWDTDQPVTLRAAEDNDTLNGKATIRISASGIPDKDITAIEVDNDILNFVTDKNEILIDEGDTNTFQVKLSSQPSSDVEANISRASGDNDISVSTGANPTFTPSNWDTYQTVTLRAAEDNDTVNGKATIRISASGIPDKDITAIEVDNDSLSFITDTDEVSIDEGDSNTFQVKLSARPSSDVATSISRESGDSDISVSGGSTSLNFTPSNWNTYQTVTLAAAEDTDTTNGQATIRISATGIGDKYITATEVDNDSLTFVTNRKKVWIGEGNTAKFKVKLSAKPSSNVVSSVSFIKQKISISYPAGISQSSSSDVVAEVKRLSGDNDISVASGAKLTFTTSNWDKDQEVTLKAAEDEDKTNGVATIRISAPGIPNNDITATEVDDDIPNFETDIEEVLIDEGSTNTLQVRLSKPPSSDVEASISVSSDSDISVTAGSSLTFTTSNWNEYQPVALEAAEDDDMANDTATIQISAPAETGIPDKEITATIVDNDIPDFVTDNDEVEINEGSTNTFQVQLSQKPTSDITASISWVSGDSDIKVVSGSNLTFTSDNWDTYQPVTLEAAEDDDEVNGEATIRISAPETEIQDKDITAKEIENDTSFVTDKDEVSIDEGNTNTFQVKLSQKPTSDVAASISWVSGDSDIRIISGSNLTFTPLNWDTYQPVTLEADEDDDALNGETIIGISTGTFGISDKEITATENDNDLLNFETNTDVVSIDEGSTNTFQLRLSAKPSSNINASVSIPISNDCNISVISGSDLTFTSENWNTYQTVTLKADEDDDNTVNGQATIRISATGIDDKDITATENDNDSP
jgi:tetratricopeptide (TPR) repeat protein/phospholipid N-methyltransferase